MVGILSVYVRACVRVHVSTLVCGYVCTPRVCVALSVPRIFVQIAGNIDSLKVSGFPRDAKLVVCVRILCACAQCVCARGCECADISFLPPFVPPFFRYR